MLTNTDMASVLLRQHVTRSEFLLPLVSIKEVAWHILLHIYAAPSATGCYIDELTLAFEMPQPDMARYLAVLLRLHYVTERSGTIRLTASARSLMDTILHDMAQELLPIGGA